MPALTAFDDLKMEKPSQLTNEKELWSNFDPTWLSADLIDLTPLQTWILMNADQHINHHTINQQYHAHQNEQWKSIKRTVQKAINQSIKAEKKLVPLPLEWPVFQSLSQTNDSQSASQSKLSLVEQRRAMSSTLPLPSSHTAQLKKKFQAVLSAYHSQRAANQTNAQSSNKENENSSNDQTIEQSIDQSVNQADSEAHLNQLASTLAAHRRKHKNVKWATEAQIIGGGAVQVHDKEAKQNQSNKQSDSQSNSQSTDQPDNQMSEAGSHNQSNIKEAMNQSNEPPSDSVLVSKPMLELDQLAIQSSNQSISQETPQSPLASFAALYLLDHPMLMGSPLHNQTSDHSMNNQTINKQSSLINNDQISDQSIDQAAKQPIIVSFPAPVFPAPIEPPRLNDQITKPQINQSVTQPSAPLLSQHTTTQMIHQSNFQSVTQPTNQPIHQSPSPRRPIVPPRPRAPLTPIRPPQIQTLNQTNSHSNSQSVSQSSTPTRQLASPQSINQNIKQAIGAHIQPVLSHSTGRLINEDCLVKVHRQSSTPRRSITHPSNNQTINQSMSPPPVPNRPPLPTSSPKNFLKRSQSINQSINQVPKTISQTNNQAISRSSNQSNNQSSNHVYFPPPPIGPRGHERKRSRSVDFTLTH